MKDFIELTFENGEKIMTHFSTIASVKQTNIGCIVTLKDGKTVRATNPYNLVADFIRREEK
jgi:hypothetical protein